MPRRLLVQERQAYCLENDRKGERCWQGVGWRLSATPIADELRLVGASLLTCYR